ncbi:MAG TPA: metal-dependent hydrolase [Armatimonadetes bacterium]|nr:metal-dependent hydrolase [Armatimonadota bacterium]
MRFKIIDVHAHFGRWFFPIHSDSIDDIRMLMERNGIEYCALSSSLAVTYDLVEGNAELARAIEGMVMFLGYVVINPNYPEISRQEIDKYLGRGGFVGVKMHPGYTGRPLSDPRNISLLEYAWKKFEKPALLHTWGSCGVDQVKKVATELPEMPIILGHMGGSFDWPAAARLAKEQRNVYLEPCGSILPPERIREAVEIAGERKVLFGSDLTLINPAFVLGNILASGLSEAELERVLYWNAKELFRLP